MSADELPAELVARVRRLRRLRRVPDGVLAEIVAVRGLIRDRLSEEALSPAVEPGADPAEVDRAMAARLCAGCPVLDECLELDLRWMADQTVGVFAGLPDEAAPGDGRPG